MLRPICFVFVGCLALTLGPQLALAQTVVGTPTRAIQTASTGYCFTDLNNNNAVDLNEIDVTVGTEAMTDATIPGRIAVTTGNRTILPSAIHAFNNWANITALGEYNIDIAGFCIGSVSRSDVVNTALDDDGNGSADRTVATTRTENSVANNYFDDDGFTFVGGTATDDQVISFSGQVSGNIGAIASQSHISLTLNNDVEIDGLLDLGNTKAISDAVLNLAGQIDEVDLDGASDLTVTSSAKIGDSGSSATNYASSTIGTLGLAGVTDSNFTLSGSITSIDLAAASNITINNSASVADIDATNITNGVFLTNASQVGSIDLSGTKYLDLDLNSGSLVGTLNVNNSTSSSSLIDNAGGIERLEIGNSSATEKVEMTVINSGEISALTSGAVIINDTNAAGGEIDVSVHNSGAIEAATSQALDLSSLDGGRLNFNNSGTVSTNASGNNNAVFGEGAKGLVYMENSGTISSNANHAVNLKNFEGYFRIVNSGSISSNQKAIDLAGASGGTASVVAIHNGYVLNSSNEIVAANSGSREIKATGQNAILLDGVSGDISLANAAGSSIIAEDSLAIAASGVIGNISLTNAGSIRAHRVAPGLSNNMAISLTGTKGDISFTSTAGLIDARDRTVNLESVNGKIDFSNGGTISSTQEINDADATATDNYAVRLTRTGAGNDESTIANSGTISSSTDHALLIDALTCNSEATALAYCLTNSGTLSAARQYALAGNGMSNLKFTNSGTVTARDETVKLTDLSGAVVINNSGTISATQNFPSLYPDPDATSYAMQFSEATGVETSIAFTNAASGTISSTGGTALSFVGFDGGSDSVTFTNSGSIIAGGDNAVDLTGANVVSMTNQSGATISAGGNYALLVDGLSGGSVVVSNLGTISAGATTVGNEPAAVHGALAASVSNISLTNGAGAVISSVGNALPNSDSNSGAAIFLNADGASLTIANSGTISVGTPASGATAAIEGNNAIRVLDIGANAVSITNSETGSIRAEGDTAIYLKGGSAAISAITLTNSGTASITADDKVVLLEDIIDASADITNSGSIYATDSAADHLLNFTNVSADFSLINSGIIESAGTRAVYVNMNNTSLLTNEMVVFNNQSGGSISADSETVAFLDVNEQVNFDNSGTISATTGASAVTFSGVGAHPFDFTNNTGGIISSSTGNAVVLSGLTDKATVVNNGVIEVTAGSNALSVWAGDETNFHNSGRIEASGNSAVAFDNFVVNAATLAPQFSNGATGIIQAASNAFEIDVTGATGQIYTLNNAGSIIADVGAHAVNMSGAVANLINSGTISSAASPAILAGASSDISISGTVAAGGTTPVAIALEGRGSVVNLSDGATIIGTIAALDTSTDYTNAEKHRVNLTGTANASYYYEFSEAQFRFFVGDEELTDGSGFSAATANFEAMTLMHSHHAQGTNNIWRQLGRFSGAGGLRSFAFSDRLNNEQANGRAYELEGDRYGLVQSFEQSIFGWFDAELVLVANQSRFELDKNVFTYDKAYQAVGLGFSDLLSWGPLSFSAMALTGIGQNDVTRMVKSNTSASGSFHLKSSYDTVYLDAFFEALLDMRIWGKETRLTRRNPFRLHMELGLGGALHSESNDGYREQSYVKTDDNNMESTSVGGRLKFEVEMRNPYARNDITAFVEFEQNIFDTTSDNEFDYSVQGAAATAAVEKEQVAISSVAIGAYYQLSRDMRFILSLASSSGDNDTDENSLTAALKWRF
jgi:hypothetical protein